MPSAKPSIKPLVQLLAVNSSAKPLVQPLAVNSSAKPLVQPLAVNSSAKYLVQPLAALLFAALLVFAFVASPPAASAATVELTASVKASFDKTVAAADTGSKTKLTGLYDNLGSLLKTDKDMEAKIKALYYRNEETLLLLRKAIREIDAAKLAQLEQQVKQAKERHQPLFDAYTALNKRISAAKSLKNKTLTSLLQTQADAMKLVVQFAREEIRTKDAAHKAAKSAASKKIKSARDSLAAVDTIKVQIKAQKSAASQARKNLSPSWANFKYAMKNKDPKGTLNALSALVSTTKQIVALQEKIYALETKITEVAAKTKTQFL